MACLEKPLLPEAHSLIRIFSLLLGLQLQPISPLAQFLQKLVLSLRIRLLCILSTLLLGEKIESEGWGLNKILQNGVYVTLLGQKQEGSHGEEVSLTIDSEEENLGKFESSREADSSPVLSTVLTGQVLNLQG